ncbi:MAG: hypothetical protein K6G56_03900 [Clostridiales bacterium]|nr:hypothetical protein [Clostridiales bacterium]
MNPNEKEGFILPDAGGIEGGLPHPLEKEIRRKECPPGNEVFPVTEPPPNA